MRVLAMVAAALAAWGALPAADTARLRSRHSAAAGRLHDSRTRSSRRRFRRPGQRSIELPLAVELMAVCVSAGLPPQDAMATVGRAVPDDLGAAFAAAARSLIVGVPMEHAWSPAFARWPELRRVAETMGHTARGGTELVPALVSIAADQRRAVLVARTRAARRVGVLAAVPLGFCFLPAFVLVSVVPLVAGLLQELPAF
ncbi:MAG: type II secretion system F family protein [Mycobacteriales bacterium]